MEQRRIARALLSVSDKTGLADFAHALRAKGIEIVSTGGTAKALREAGIAVTEIAEITGSPEMMDGRVKTLHPKIHGGLLAVRGNEAHERALAEHAISPIDLLVVNLYPFEQTVASGADFETCIENIDIGGPALIRAAAKNHESVTVVVDPADYASVLAEMEANGGATTPALRKALAGHAFAATAAYDAAISAWFSGQLGERTPRIMAIAGRLAEALRYGENPHQWAAFYRTGERHFGVGTAVQVQGKELSYNNFNDTDAAYELVAEFDPKTTAAVAIIKHANPCGVALGATLAEAYRRALACDPVSAFGGIVALNRDLDADAAREIVKIFTEVIIAPDASDEATAIVAEKKNLRLLLAGVLPDPKAEGRTLRSLAGGFLVQSRDNAIAESRIEGRDQAEAEQERVGRSHLRLHRGEARQVERHRLCERRRHDRHRRRPDVAHRCGADGGMEGGRGGRGARARSELDRGLRRRFGCLLPLRRWAESDRRGRRHRGHPARRVAPRRRGHRRGRRSGPRHGVRGAPPLPALRCNVGDTTHVVPTLGPDVL